MVITILDIWCEKHKQKIAFCRNKDTWQICEHLNTKGECEYGKNNKFV
jgi:hypothetical protein